MATDSRPRKLWTKEEDETLHREAETLLNQEGVSNVWSLIATKLPGRTNKDCRKRWTKVCKKVNKGMWELSEDKLLLNAVQRYGKSWTQVASVVKTRHADQCAKRWQQSLDPNLLHVDWEVKDNERLLAAVNVHGRKWKTIAEELFPGRSTTTLKNRYSLLTRKVRTPRERDYNTSSPQPESDNCMDFVLDEVGDSSSESDCQGQENPNFPNPNSNESAMTDSVFPTSISTTTNPFGSGNPYDVDFGFGLQEDHTYQSNLTLGGEGTFSDEMGLSSQQGHSALDVSLMPWEAGLTESDILKDATGTMANSFGSTFPLTTDLSAQEIPLSQLRSKVTLVLEDVAPTTMNRVVDMLMKDKVKMEMTLKYEGQDASTSK